MTDREAWAEVAAVIEADMRVSLDGRVVTPASVRRAAIEAVETLMPPLPEVIVERDASDTNRINVLVPAEWFATVGAILRRGEQ